jgi:hypothetical protein
MGRPPISTIGLGRTTVSSESRVPRPPASITAFMVWISAPVAVALQEAEALASNFPTQYNRMSSLKAGAISLAFRIKTKPLNTPPALLRSSTYQNPLVTPTGALIVIADVSFFPYPAIELLFDHLIKVTVRQGLSVVVDLFVQLQIVQLSLI